MHNALAYLKHRISATNQHGVHSPFVYAYITKCLYTKSDDKAAKSDSIFKKSSAYFEVEKVKIIADDPNRTRSFYAPSKGAIYEQPPYDVIYVEHPKTRLITDLKDELHNDSFLFLNNIHRTKDNRKVWNALFKDERVTVSLDVFYCGLLFFRKEQEKEHFKIRI